MNIARSTFASHCKSSLLTWNAKYGCSHITNHAHRHWSSRPTTSFYRRLHHLPQLLHASKNPEQLRNTRFCDFHIRKDFAESPSNLVCLKVNSCTKRWLANRCRSTVRSVKHGSVEHFPTTAVRFIEYREMWQLRLSKALSTPCTCEKLCA